VRALRQFGRDLRSLLELALGSRFVLYAVVDLILLGGGLLDSLAGGGEPSSIYVSVVVLPLLLLGVPAQADLVALERRAGSLDLALAIPDPQRYFIRRTGAVGLVLALQSALSLAAIWAAEAMQFPILPALLQALALAVLLSAVALFWALKVASPGGVWFASLVSILALFPWTLANPIPARGSEASHPFVGSLAATLPALGNALVVAIAATLFYLYARRRLAHPERMLA